MDSVSWSHGSYIRVRVEEWVPMAYKYWQAWYQYSKPDGTEAVLVQVETRDNYSDARADLLRLRQVHDERTMSGLEREIASGVAPSETKLTARITR